MKKELLTVALLLWGIVTFAQVGTDLQFSQIINSPPFPSGIATVTVGTVPSGKIWKLVGFSCKVVSSSAECSINNGLSNEDIYLRHMTSDGTLVDAQLPLFFKENETITFSGGNGSAQGFVSMIEYTVLP